MSRSLLVMIVALVPVAAQANGAFPDASQIMVPGDQPQQIFVGTNFGVVVSDDNGATWTWTCEEQIGSFARLYQQGAAPSDRLYAIPTSGMVTSSDHACTWTPANGSFDAVNDAFPDPSDPMHVLGAAQGTLDGGTSGFYLVESHDGGQNFDDLPKYVPPAGYSIDTVEISAGAPMTVYLTLTDTVGKHVWLGHSTNGGTSFSLADIGTDQAGIAKVDPANPLRVFLRLQTPNGDTLGITSDGATVAPAIRLGSSMTAFLLRSDGTLLVAAGNGTAFQSHDGGANWTPWANGLHIRALAERAGVLYAAASDITDGFAVGSSTDGGTTWKPLLRLRDIQGPQGCVWEKCAVPWTKLKALIGSTDVLDGGAGDDMAVDMGAPPPNPGGCSCDLSDAAAPGGALLAAMLALLTLVRAWRRGRRLRLQHRP